MSGQFAVMGNPVAHSLSPLIHQHFAKQTGIALTYETIGVPEDKFLESVAQFFANGGQGLNITLPFKQEAYALATVRTARCERAAAANMLWMHKQQVHADNTDGVGLVRDLGRFVDLANQRVLILGAGGAARGIIPPLLEASVASLTVLNRTLAKAKALQAAFPAIACVSGLSKADSFDVIINATSAGLAGGPWSWELGCPLLASFCYDLSYSLDAPTPFVEWARAQGARAADGLGMLVQQGAEAFLIWHGVMPKTAPVLEWLRP